MLKVYGSGMCPDCIKCKYNLDKNNIDYENIDITQNLKGLKEFLKFRDKEEVFNDAKENGYIGIPALITEDGEITLDWENYFTELKIEVVHPQEEGTSCSVDGKGC
ncbi:glutaredoxin domain-containing protein [Butyrivibrio sp. WCE2006]|uniref:glutaredoxin domain-containing protein n=1 Tax=Butyrivibrio sp. WCE2006 TaxID=1410611 RepID=UPI0005D1F0F3|nr:glutaredoxin domain-containing protein [Butyrivibrio sp. WCE2006]